MSAAYCPFSPTRSVIHGVLALMSFFIVGCGTKEEAVELIPVSGKVTVGNTPLPGGQVSFHPDSTKGNNSQKVPTGTIQSDGTYSLITGTASGAIKEGAPPGWYKVTVSPTMALADSSPQSKVKMPFFNLDYSNVKNTSLSIEVKPGAANYDLKMR